MQITATYSPYAKKARTRSLQFIHDLYAFKKGLKNKKNDLIVGHTLIVGYFFLKKLQMLWTMEPSQQRNGPYAAAGAKVDLLSSRPLIQNNEAIARKMRVKLPYLQSQVAACCHIHPIICPIYGWCCPNRCCFHCADYPTRCRRCN